MSACRNLSPVLEVLRPLAQRVKAAAAGLGEGWRGLSRVRMWRRTLFRAPDPKLGFPDFLTPDRSEDLRRLRQREAAALRDEFERLERERRARERSKHSGLFSRFWQPEE